MIPNANMKRSLSKFPFVGEDDKVQMPEAYAKYRTGHCWYVLALFFLFFHSIKMRFTKLAFQSEVSSSTMSHVTKTSSSMGMSR